MGGDTLSSFASEDNSSLENGCPELSYNSRKSYRDEDESVSRSKGFVCKDFYEMGHPNSSNHVEFDYNMRRRESAYNEIMKNYDDILVRSESLYQAKSKILRYTPGSWINDVGDKKLGNFRIPKMTTLLLVGPKGSGKSSLVNKISRVFEDDKFASERAQVTYNSSCGEGTFFLEEYMIPRSGATSFCLFDTRSMSEDFADNEVMIKQWMTKGIRHGELLIRDSDSSSLKMALKCKARESGSSFSKIRKVNFVIFVVNGFSVLRSMNSDKEEDKNYIENVVKTFNCPYLSFKDDKPVVAVTHGDLLSLEDRACVRIYLGEKLGVPPAKQIFDIPENSDQATELTILDMIRYSLEHADKNLTYRGFISRSERSNLLDDDLSKGYLHFLLTLLFLAMFTGLMLRIVFPIPMPQPSHLHRTPFLTFSEKWHSKSQVKPPEYKPQEPLTPSPSNLQSNSTMKHSHEKYQETQTTSPPPMPSKSVVDRPCKKRGSTRNGHPKTQIKWHEIRHIW